MNDVKKRKWLKRNDILFIAGLIILSVITLIAMRFIKGKSDIQAVISCDGKDIKIIDLKNEENKIFTLEQNSNVSFEINNGAIRFINVDCPDKLCENFGYIKNPGNTAICLPNKVVLRIDGTEKNEIDAIVN